jgi:hypothetical protein
MHERWSVKQGDCRDVMRAMPQASVDAIVSDPPYGLVFMGKGWDHAVPGVEFWAEALRVAKPGAHLVAFGGTRTFHRLAVAIEDAGWEIRDTLSWLHGQGFPKSHNGAWGGTALKPAWEPIILARKPLAGTVAANVAQHGTGGLNVDGCRIGTTVETWPKSRNYSAREMSRPGSTAAADATTQSTGPVPAGRWPANVVLDEAAAAMVGEQSGKRGGGFGVRGGKRRGNDDYGLNATGETVGYGDTGGASRFFYTAKASRREREAGLDRTCTVKHITGLCETDNKTLAASLRKATSDTPTVSWLIDESGESIMGLCPSDSLSITLTAISRITTSEICNWWTPLRTSASTEDASLWTASGGSRAESAASASLSNLSTTSDGTASALGASGVVSAMLSTISDGANWKPLRNVHSTVKPIALMRWLCRLVTPPGGLILDPFTGSGTTGCAAVLEGFRFYGAELDAEYADIARRRIAYWAAHADADAKQPTQLDFAPLADADPPA